jgi:FKBP-type peptidyl-prolyl cis-trans isomerase
MKKILVLGLIALFGLGSCGTVSSRRMSTDLDTLSYAYGLLYMAPGLKAVDTLNNISPDMAIQAIRDFMKDSPKITSEAARAFIDNYFMVTFPAQKLKESVDFLAGIEKQSSIQKTESGLLYEIIEPGNDKRATQDADTVRVIYTGTLPNGKVFDSNEMHGGEPATFPLSGVIPAWTEGMKLVGEGGKVKLYVHPDLAYGAQGAGQVIAPNQALVFEVEVIEVLPATAVPEVTAQ